MNQIRLFIVDQTFDDPSSAYWPAAMRPLRQSGHVAVTGSARSPGEALARISEASVDIAVVDIARPDAETETLLDSLLTAGGGGEGIPAIVLSERVGRENMALAVAAGARGCVGRDNPEDLFKAVIEIGRGGSPIQRDLAGQPALVWELAVELRRRFLGVTGVTPPPAVKPASSVSVPCPLSGRERDVLETVADGFSYQEIGVSLGIAERTVKNHMSHVLDKLGARGRAHAVRVAIGAGWICTGNRTEILDTTRGLEAAA